MEHYYLKLKQYIYTSTVTELLSNEQLERILEDSRAYNIANDITGFLIYCGNTFLQVLECPAAELPKVLSIISKSPQHKDMNNLITKDIDTREFPDWAMGFRNATDPETKRRFEELLTVSTENPTMAMGLIQYIAKIND